MSAAEEWEVLLPTALLNRLWRIANQTDFGLYELVLRAALEPHVDAFLKIPLVYTPGDVTKIPLLMPASLAKELRELGNKSPAIWLTENQRLNVGDGRNILIARLEHFCSLWESNPKRTNIGRMMAKRRRQRLRRLTSGA